MRKLQGSSLGCLMLASPSRLGQIRFTVRRIQLARPKLGLFCRLYSIPAQSMSEDFLIGAIDQGTTSSRFFVFNDAGEVVASAQRPLSLITPRPGWVEQNPREIIDSVNECIDEVCRNISARFARHPSELIKAIGIANQRETTVAWNRETGNPLHNAIVWLDSRPSELLADIQRRNPSIADKVQELSGLRISTYFSIGKIAWMLQNVPSVAHSAGDPSMRIGTIDSWLLSNLVGMDTHLTDLTNAHRTGLTTLEEPHCWNSELLSLFGVEAILPNLASSIKASSDFYGIITAHPWLTGVPVKAMLGDQHAALLGQNCVEPGSSKCTFGTGCFLLTNLGKQSGNTDLVNNGLLATIGYQLGPNEPVVYASEASLALGGSVLEWASQIGLIESPSCVDKEAADDADGVVFVPALSGYLSPRWDPTATGSLQGLTLSTTKGHILKAILDSIAFSTKEVVDIVTRTQKLPLKSLVVEGGLTKSVRLTQLLADVLQIDILVPHQKEGTVYGAAKAAAQGLNGCDWSNQSTYSKIVHMSDDESLRERLDAQYSKWLQSVNSK